MRPPWSWRTASTSATPNLFAGLESTDGAFGYLSKRLQVRDCGLFGRPRSHDPHLAIWLDGFNPIGATEWNEPVGLHEVDIATSPSGAQRLPELERGGRAASTMTIRRSSRLRDDHRAQEDRRLHGIKTASEGRRPDGLGDGAWFVRYDDSPNVRRT
jgi:hypothetical protein